MPYVLLQRITDHTTECFIDDFSSMQLILSGQLLLYFHFQSFHLSLGPALAEIPEILLFAGYYQIPHCLSCKNKIWAHRQLIEKALILSPLHQLYPLVMELMTRHTLCRQCTCLWCPFKGISSSWENTIHRSCCPPGYKWDHSKN